MNELALFAGAGGGILGGILNGWRTVCAVEINDYCRRVLMQRQDDGMLEPFPIWNDVTTFDGRPWAGCVDIVTGGFPCQDISAAGKGAGITGERSGLWSEMARIIGEVRPRYVLVENSPMLSIRGLGTVLGDLAALGFDAEWGCISAAETGAPHKRDRMWIVANSASERTSKNHRGIRSGLERTNRRERANQTLANANGSGCQRKGPAQPTERDRDSFPTWSGEDVVNTLCDGCKADHWWKSLPDNYWHGAPHEARRQIIKSRTGDAGDVADAAGKRQPRQRESFDSGNSKSYQERKAGNAFNVRIRSEWPTEPDVGRVANGVASRLDRLKAIGNGQVPRVVAAAWEILK